MNQPPSEREGQSPEVGYADLLEHFQQVMRRFLDTQEAVMREVLEAGPERPVAPRSASVAPLPQLQQSQQYATPSVSEPPLAAAIAPPPPAAPSTVAPAPVARSLPNNAAPSPGAPVVPSVAPVAVSRDDIAHLLMAQVSDRTGYPAESLSLDADLEADLGIDSIKRVEIVGEVLRALAGHLINQPDIEVLTSMRSLGEVADQLARFVSTDAQPDSVKAVSAPPAAAPAGSRISRYVVRSFPAEPPSNLVELAPGSTIAVVGDSDGAASELVRLLGEGGTHAVAIAPSTAVEELQALSGRLAGVVYLEPVTNSPQGIENLFSVAKAVQPDLEAAATSEHAAFMAVTRLDGAFGFEAPNLTDAAQGSVAGLMKTIAHEWQGVSVKALDLVDVSPQVRARQVLTELRADDGLVEVGYGKDGTRTTPKLIPSPLPPVSDSPAGLTSESVVLVTGGARGITAEVCVALAAASRATLVLVGRTEAPSDSEPADTAAADNERDIKRIIFERFKAAGKPPTPVQIESSYQQLIREREIRATLQRVAQAGSRVAYLACDVRDEAAFGALIENVYKQYGRIDGVIHGAGLIEDRLVADKSVDSFRRVYETKVTSAAVLASHLRPAMLSFLVHFSSVSARFGNQGQSDYAAANEVLNKHAQALDRAWPGRVVAINWGPWVGAGMVTAEAERHFAERGIGLIPLDVGSRMLLEELASGAKGECEVVIGELTADLSASFLATEDAQPRAPEQPPAAPVRADSIARVLPFFATRSSTVVGDAGLESDLTLSLDHDLFLNDHVLDGNAVLPFTGAMELMLEAASLLCPQLQAVRVRDIRAFRGIVLDGRSVTLKVRAKASNTATGTEVSVEIAPDDATATGLHYRGFVDMARSLEPLTVPSLPAGESVFPMSMRSVYSDWLFHGPQFQAIESIESLDDAGLSAVLRGSSVNDCISDVGSLTWLADPVLMDAAFQLVLVWARHHWDITLLPSSVAAFHLAPAIRNFRGPVRCELRVRPESQSPICHIDASLYDSDGTPVAMVDDLQCAGSKALNRLAGELARQPASK